MPNFVYRKRFLFQTFNEKNYDFNDRLTKNKVAVPAYLPACSFQCIKKFIGAYLQLVVNKGTSNRVFPDIIKNAYLTPIYKKKLVSKNYKPVSVAQLYLNYL